LNYPLLALDAATGRSFCCLLLSASERFVAESEGSRMHSHSLMPMLEGLLERAGIGWSDLKMLALGIGPGSFTGLRIASASLAGINASLQLPVLPFSSLAVTALQADCEESIYVFEDARAGEVYVGRYLGVSALQDDQCMRWESLIATEARRFTSAVIPPIEMDGWMRMGPVLHRGEAMAIVIDYTLKRPQKKLSKYVQPAYLQISQAEKNLYRK